MIPFIPHLLFEYWAFNVYYGVDQSQTFIEMSVLGGQ